MVKRSPYPTTRDGVCFWRDIVSPWRRKEKLGTGTLSHWQCQCFNRSCICIGPTPEIHTVLKLGRMAAHFAEHTGVCLQIIPSSHLGRSATVEKSSPQFGFHAEETTIVSCQDRQRAFGFKDVENGKPHQNLTALDVNDRKMQEAYYVVQFVIIGRKNINGHWGICDFWGEVSTVLLPPRVSGVNYRIKDSNCSAGRPSSHNAKMLVLGGGI